MACTSGARSCAVAAVVLVSVSACHGERGPAEPCTTTASSTLPGVAISFPDAPCRFTLAQAQAGVQLSYEVVVDQTLGGVLPRAQDAGGCGTPGDSGLIVFERLTGAGQRYCLCDRGLCPPQLSLTTVQPGRHAGSITWDGRNWTGPSDSSNPKGAPFPAGDYEFSVSAVGTWRVQGTDQPFEVVGTLRVTLTP